MAKSRTESTWEINNYGKYINDFLPNTIKSIRQYEMINKKICTQKMSIIFNEIFMYIYIYISSSHMDKEEFPLSLSLSLSLSQSLSLNPSLSSFDPVKSFNPYPKSMQS